MTELNDYYQKNYAGAKKGLLDFKRLTETQIRLAVN